MRSRGITLNEWCKSNGVAWSATRNVTFGMSAWPRSKAVLDQLTDAAGREIVIAAYRTRMDAEARKLAASAKVAA